MSSPAIMRITIYFFAVFILVTVFSSPGIAQTKSQKAALTKMISTFSSSTVQNLNRNRDSFKYKLENRNIFYSDLDTDGDFDAVAELFFCEKTSCHPTSKSSRLVIFVNNRGRYSLIAQKAFSLYGKINSIDDGKINVDIYDLEEEDPQCCPDLKRSETYQLKDRKLIRAGR